MLGSTELIVILMIVVLLFGSTAIPKLAKSIRKAKNEFEKGMEDDDVEVLPKKEKKQSTSDKKNKK